MLFQEFNLFPHMTVLQNCIEAPIRVRGIQTDEAVAFADEILEKVGLQRQAQRVPLAAIGRAEAASSHRARTVHGAEGADVR